MAVTITYFVPDKYIETPSDKEGYPVFAANNEAGILVTKASMKVFLEKIKCSLKNESPCEYEGVHLAELQKIGNETEEVKPTEPVKKEKVKFSTWNGSEALKTYFKTSAEKLVKELGMNVSISIPHGEIEKANPKSETFNIFIFSGPTKKGTAVLAPQKMWGIQVSCRDSFDFSSEDSEKKDIITPEGFVVGEILYNNMYIFHDIAHNGVHEEMVLFDKFIDEAIHTFKYGPRKMEEFIDMHRKVYVEMCKNRSNLKLEEAKKGIIESELKIDEYNKVLIQTIRLLNDFRDTIQNLGKKSKDEERRYSVEFDAMLKSDKIKQINCSSDVITVSTKKLFVVDPRTEKKHEIGEFLITLNINTGKIKYTNRTRKVNAYENGMQGPHIFAHGGACQGDMGEILPKLVAVQEFAAIVSLSIQFVENVNVADSAGQHVHMWPYENESEEDYKKRYDKIWDLKQRGQSYRPEDIK